MHPQIDASLFKTPFDRPRGNELSSYAKAWQPREVNIRCAGADAFWLCKRFDSSVWNGP